MEKKFEYISYTVLFKTINNFIINTTCMKQRFTLIKKSITH